MEAPPSIPPGPASLETSAGDFTLQEYRLRSGGREWTAWHTGAVLTFDDEQRVIGAATDRLPYGVSLWPSAIALAHEVAAREADFRGRSALELGSGTGLPGIVAASLGARVVQTDRDELALHLGEKNAGRNGVAGIELRLADWTTWDVPGRFDWILGADILYGASLHGDLRKVFAASLAPGGRILLADPLRPMSLRLLEAMEREGWTITMSRYELGDDPQPAPIGVFELIPPGPVGA